MRVTSELFVSALIRRVYSGGGFAAVEHRGSPEAGAIFVRRRGRDGLETLYGPAPQSFFDESDAGTRMFEIRLADAEAPQIDALLERERRFDPDLWVVELEADGTDGLLDIAVEPKAGGDFFRR